MHQFRLLVVRGGRRPTGLERTVPVGRGDADDGGGDDDTDDGPELLVLIDGLAAFDGWDGRGLSPDDLLNPDYR